MKSFSNISIKNKLIAIILGVTLLTLGLGFAFFISININTFKKDMVNNSIMNAKVIGEYCVTPLIFDDNSGAEEVLLKLKNIPSIVKGCVYDNEGNLFASFGNVEKNYEFAMPEDWTLSEFKGEYLHVIEPIIYHGEKYGAISIYVTTDLLNKKITDYLVTTLIILLILIVISYFLALRVQTIISKPILNLANVSGEITKKADYSIRAQKKGNDEIGILYDRFNEMIKQIELRTLEKDKAEESLKKSEEKFRKQIEYSPIGIAVLDKNEIPEYVNRKYLETIGYTEGDIKNINEWYLLAYPDKEYRKRVLKKWNANVEKAAREGKDIQPSEYNVTCKDGKVRVMEISGTFIADKMLTIFNDITDRKQAEEELKKHREHLEELIKERTKELEEKNKELERYNKLFEGREFRIKELRDKVKEMEERLKISD
ncbi:MAG: PAS domain S-box protein [Bacteroidales bacterium]|nr:PAS domain S-box protein [Bacteroidales bacterium]